MFEIQLLIVIVVSIKKFNKKPQTIEKEKVKVTSGSEQEKVSKAVSLKESKLLIVITQARST